MTPLILALPLALLLATTPLPTGEGYLVQIEQGSGRKWHGPLTRFAADGPDAWLCLWQETRPTGQHDWHRKVRIELAGDRITVEEFDPGATWRGTVRRNGRRIEAEGIGRKGRYRRHYCVFTLRATLPDPSAAGDEGKTAETNLK